MSLNLGIIASSRSGTAPVISYLLDTYTGAAAAFSLRKLRSAYTGSAIRVRRSSDNTETDIGFNVGGELDTIALITFVGAGNGFVRTWYDQSGNGKNITQITTGNQPSIVISGVVRLFNSKPSLYFSNSTLTLLDTSLTLIQPNTYFVVSEGTTTNNTGYRTINDGFFVTGANRNSFGKSDTNVYYLYAGSLISSTTTYSTIKSLITAIFNSASSYLYRNQTALISNQNAGNISQLGIYFGGASATQNLYEGYFPEYIIYNSNQSANRTGIESNINSFYSIY